MKVAQVMSSGLGRGIRIVLGAALIAVGLLVVGGTWGTILAVVGIAPIFAGVFNFCLMAPILGAPLRGSEAAGRA